MSTPTHRQRPPSRPNVLHRLRAALCLTLLCLLLGSPSALGARLPDPAGGGSRPPAIASPLPDLAPRGIWRWPLAPRPRVAQPFVAPSSTYGPGHRGVDLVGRAGQEVIAVASGTVTHVGVVAGRGTVTITHADGLRSTYEPVDAAVGLGQSVSTGQTIGRLSGAGWHCPSACVHLGAIEDETYLDPLRLLRWWRVRLLPLA